MATKRQSLQPVSSHAYPGYFVVVEGLDASGKTTLAKRLVTTFRKRGCGVTAVREPGGTRASEQVRRILLDTRSSLSARTELFLYLAARAELVDQVILPALAKGEIVIADRFSLSTMAYQVGGRKLPARAVVSADRLARQGLAPDCTIVLTVTEAQAAKRRRAMTWTPDRIERESGTFFRNVRAEYRRRSHGGRRQVVIDSAIGAEAVFETAIHLLEPRLKRRGIL